MYVYINIYVCDDDNTKEKAEVELNISSYIDVSTNCIFSRELFCLYSKQLFFNGNAYQKHTICENTTYSLKMESVIKEKQIHSNIP